MKVVLNTGYGGFRLSDSALTLLNRSNPDRNHDYYYHNRHDKNLVKVVEDLGEKAGEYSTLEVVEWSEDLPYCISEYDGWESLIVDIQSIVDKHEKEIEESATPLAQDLLKLKKYLDKK